MMEMYEYGKVIYYHRKTLLITNHIIVKQEIKVYENIKINLVKQISHLIRHFFVNYSVLKLIENVNKQSIEFFKGRYLSFKKKSYKIYQFH